MPMVQRRRVLSEQISILPCIFLYLLFFYISVFMFPRKVLQYNELDFEGKNNNDSYG